MPHTRRSFGVLSDTHGYVDPALETHFRGLEGIFHAGDIGDPNVLELLGQWAPVYAVRGNIDGGELRFLPEEIEQVIAGRRLLVRHIAGNPFKPNPRARVLLATAPDILIVGHSHIAVFRRVGSTLWINPGAAGREGFHTERTAALLHFDDQGLAIDKILLGPRR